jgi:4-hydroxybenzoate polyprenyltransferase
MGERSRGSFVTVTSAVLKDLVRLPAVLSAPGDALVGMAASHRRGLLRTVLGGAASAALYAGGMALNDVADREVDAEERPSRPIPSGRISAKAALAVGEGLCVLGVAAAAGAGGRRSARRSLAVAGAVHLYDFAAKRVGGTVAAASMAGCRMADIAMGAGSLTAAAPAMAVVGAHTFSITKVSQSEVVGGDPTAARTAAVTAAAVSVSTLVLAARSARRNPLAMAVAVGSVAVYAVPFGQAARRAMRDPSPANTGAVVGSGVKGMIPLQGALAAGSGRPLIGASITAQWFLAKRLSRKRSVT